MTFDGMLAETLPKFLRIVTQALVVYAIATFLIELRIARYLGLIGFVVVMILFGLPNLAVLGAWGPAHVAVNSAAPAWPLFLVLLIVKTVSQITVTGGLF